MNVWLEYPKVTCKVVQIVLRAHLVLYMVIGCVHPHHTITNTLVSSSDIIDLDETSLCNFSVCLSLSLSPGGTNPCVRVVVGKQKYFSKVVVDTISPHWGDDAVRHMEFFTFTPITSLCFCLFVVFLSVCVCSSRLSWFHCQGLRWKKMPSLYLRLI